MSKERVETGLIFEKVRIPEKQVGSSDLGVLSGVVGVEPIPVKDSDFTSDAEKYFVKELLKVDLKEATKEVEKRVSHQYMDRNTLTPVFNAFAKTVHIRDENGEKLIIDNHDHIRRQKLFNSGKLNAPVQTPSDNGQNIEVDYDDDLDFLD